MAKVLGLGGVFFKAEDPAALRGWYARVLGLEVSDWGAMFQHPKVGAVTWAPFVASANCMAGTSRCARVRKCPAPFRRSTSADSLGGGRESIQKSIHRMPEKWHKPMIFG